MSDALGWLTGCSEAELRRAAPQFAGETIVLDGEPDLTNPIWASARALVGDHTFAKFAFSQRTAVRIWREAQLLGVLGDLGLPVPELVATSRRPVFSATRLIRGGAPLDFETGAVDEMAVQLAGFLSRLHDDRTLARARAEVESLSPLPEPGLHLSTDDLRARFPVLRPTVTRWCDWVDEQLALPSGTVLVHGDFHPYNQLWDVDEPRLLAVVDFETSGLAEPEFDFRVLPVFGPSVDLLVATVEHYEALSGRTLSVSRVMALHVLNHLSDSLWRTEAGIPAPGGTPTEHVETSANRLSALGIEP